MKYKKKILPKIMAAIALAAILVGILGTGALVIISSISPEQESQISAEELQQYIDSLSGAVVEPSESSSGVELNTEIDTLIETGAASGELIE